MVFLRKARAFLFNEKATVSVQWYRVLLLFVGCLVFNYTHACSCFLKLNIAMCVIKLVLLCPTGVMFSVKTPRPGQHRLLKSPTGPGSTAAQSELTVGKQVWDMLKVQDPGQNPKGLGLALALTLKSKFAQLCRTAWGSREPSFSSKVEILLPFVSLSADCFCILEGKGGGKLFNDRKFWAYTLVGNVTFSLVWKQSSVTVKSTDFS